MNKFDVFEEDSESVNQQQIDLHVGEKFLVLCDQELKKIVENAPVNQDIQIQTTASPDRLQAFVGVTGSFGVTGSGYGPGYAGLRGVAGYTGTAPIFAGVTGYVGATGMISLTGTAQTTSDPYVYPTTSEPLTHNVNNNDSRLLCLYDSLLNNVKTQSSKSRVLKIFGKKEKTYSKFSVL